MTVAITFDALTLTNTGSMVNFGNFPRAMSNPSTVYNSNARSTPIFVTNDNDDSPPPFTGSYTILTGGLTEYDAIKAKEAVIGTLVRGSETLTTVLLQSVSSPNLSGGVVTCTLTFVLGAV